MYGNMFYVNTEKSAYMIQVCSATQPKLQLSEHNEKVQFTEHFYSKLKFESIHVAMHPGYLMTSSSSAVDYSRTYCTGTLVSNTSPYMPCSLKHFHAILPTFLHCQRVHKKQIKFYAIFNTGESGC